MLYVGCTAAYTQKGGDLARSTRYLYPYCIYAASGGDYEPVYGYGYDHDHDFVHTRFPQAENGVNNDNGAGMTLAG
ncbi:hypothetical protein CCHR01_13791 [Colletotrichum chrysophilum]|uniref:Uncharacterized protein n=1 Tax=Colletotrichum chrysophilum TaxID=1836956 RepID=A0AAD9EA66_9PEZI|nr:hypothetical protein CCHR01_13791 [Colletotrichum chrysophilum]